MIHDFNYLKANTVKEALGFLDQYKEDCKIICGGQSLLILMRQALVAPEYLVDIKNVKELDYIEFDAEKGLRIGAATTHSSIEKSALAKEHYTALVDMENNLASNQTRNWGTIGGNLAHGDPSGDPACVLSALNASLTVANKEKERIVPVEDFTLDFFETALEENELLLEIQIPVVPPKTAIVYEKFNIIKNDMGLVSAAVSMTLDETKSMCKDVRIILGGAGPAPLRAKEAEYLVRGAKIDEAVFEAAGEKASDEAEPLDDIHATEEYRRQLIKVLTKNMLKKAAEQAKLLS
jgi:CO/xanthine dehydrogenase FAD-binding subunit